MTKTARLFSLAFLAINIQFALVTAIAAMFFAYSSYLTQLGISAGSIGFILSADALAALMIQPLIAPLVHAQVSRQWLFYASLMLSAALFLTGQVTSLPWLVAARLLQGAGFIAVLTSLTTMMVQFIPPNRSGAAFGWLSLIRLIPYAVIPLLFDLLKMTPQNFPLALKMSAIVALLPILALALPYDKAGLAGRASRPPGFLGLMQSLRSAAVFPLLLSVLFFFAGYSAVFFYLKGFGHERSLLKVSLFFTVATAVMILVRLAAGWLFDRFDKGRLGVMALMVVLVSYLALPVSASPGLFFTLAGLCGLGWGVAMPLQAALMYDVSQESARALNQNLLLVMMQGGFFLGPLIGAQLIAAFGYEGFFVGMAALTMIASMAMMQAGRQARRPGAKRIQGDRARLTER